MNLNSEQPSMEDLKALQKEKQALDRAAQTTSTVTLLEANWRALIDAQRHQIQVLSDILGKQSTLMTKEDILNYMNQQLKILREQGQATQEVMEQYQTTMQQEARSTARLLENAAKELDSQAGRMQEQFGRALSQEQEKLDKHAGGLLWISLIPTGLLLLLELVPLVWPWG